MDEVDIKAMLETEKLMSNFDHEVDQEVAARLRANPNKMRAAYPGWDFHAHCWFDGKVFKGRVMVHQVFCGIYEGETPEELMKVISNEFGWE